jgi:hypothetical protein
MHTRRFLQLTLPLATALALAGCQTPKHSNVLIFGTNTRVGLDVGYDPKLQNGGILVGYDRQEAVWMPLLANTNAEGSAPNLPAVGPVQDSLYRGADGTSTDAYAVLASFGAQFNAKASSDTAAGGGVAQFFATGLAARTLAEKGAADLLTVPSDATANARKAEAEARTAELTANMQGGRSGVSTVRSQLMAYLGTLPDASLAPVVTAAQQQNLIPPGTDLGTPAAQRSALNKYLNAGDGDTPRLQSLQSLAKGLSL